ncbi:hypothetical protein BU15DRAFT_68145 [Melanogaster broomeanus]|nr:hypothetical protein BU15DRAFT_68145 [Melanogaster broomeanus]
MWVSLQLCTNGSLYIDGGDGGRLMLGETRWLGCMQMEEMVVEESGLCEKAYKGHGYGTGTRTRDPCGLLIPVLFPINVLLDYAVRHNMVVGTFNRTGKAYAGHFHVPLKNRLAHLLDVTDGAMLPNTVVRTGWVNGNNYQFADETFGMIRLLPTLFKPLGMFEFSEEYAREQKIRHKYVAERQGTLVAVLPIHTRDERDLFQLLAHSSPLFMDHARQPHWTALASIWASHANGKTIFYKLPEHLKAYYQTWTDFCNEQNTVALNAEASQRIRALVRSKPTGFDVHAPATTPLTLRDSITVPTGVEVEEVNAWQIGNILDGHALQQSALLFTYAETARHVKSTSSSTPGGSQARKRKAPLAASDPSAITGSGLPPTLGPSTIQSGGRRKPRKCRNCQSTECPGRWMVKKCWCPPVPGIDQ